MTKRLNEALLLIPRPAQVVAAIVYLVFLGGLMLALQAGGEKLRPFEVTIFLVVSLIAPLVLCIYILLIGYVYGDARRRRMRYVLWTLLAIFIPNAIGILLYFVLRDPLPRNCLRCGGPIYKAYKHCPRCGAEANATCGQCQAIVEPDWSVCPFCGAALANARGSTARPTTV